MLPYVLYETVQQFPSTYSIQVVCEESPCDGKRSQAKNRRAPGSSLNRQNVIRTSVPVSNAVSCARRDLIEKGVHVMESTPQIARIKLNP
jgi:hypothetical protein